MVRSTNHRLGSTTKLCNFGPFDDFDLHLAHCLFHGIGKAWPLVAGIGVEPGQERVQPEQRRDEQSSTVTVLDIGCMNDGVEHQTLGVDQHMTFLTFDLLASVVAVRID